MSEDKIMDKEFEKYEQEFLIELDAVHKQLVALTRLVEQDKYTVNLSYIRAVRSDLNRVAYVLNGILREDTTGLEYHKELQKLRHIL